MNAYHIEARVTLANGKEAVFTGTAQAESYHQAFQSAVASFGGELEKAGIQGMGGVTIRIVGPDVPHPQGSVPHPRGSATPAA